MNRAVGYAMDKNHEYFTLEHVLWSLLQEIEITETLSACGGSPQELLEDLEKFLATEIPQMKEVGAGEQGEQPVATLAVQRLIQRSLFQVQSSGKDEIQPADLLVALFQAKDSQALYLIQKQGIERLDVLNYVSHGLSKNESYEMDSDASNTNDHSSANKKTSKNSKTSQVDEALKEFAENLNEKAKSGKIDPIIGRDAEISRMIQTLLRRRKNNPLLAGEAGVGKTALAEGLALRIVNGNVPELLKTAVIYSLDMGSLLAGAKFRGDFEQRLKKVLGAIQAKQQRGELPVLFIDEIHTLIGAGTVQGSSLDAANLLKPMLARGEIRCIGSTTYSEYRNVFEKDQALARRFQKIDIVEPSIGDAIQILMGLKSKFEEHHHLTYSTDAIEAAVELSSKHITDRFLPDKAIDVMDEAGAKARLESRVQVNKDHIEEMIALIARIPARTISTSQKERLKNLTRDLKLAIFGQDTAIDAITAAIRMARSGLRGTDKPIGSFLFCGPTGTGKTELTKQLAHALGVQFLRFDMSEYGEKHTVSRLIGAPPGYVGFDQQGMLTAEVLKHPHSVVLLDEIEKAHPEVWNILLQVMDHGTLTDNNGRKIDFRNTVIIMTSNVGSHEIDKRTLGIGGMDSVDGKAAKKSVEQTFTPEFRNRLDSIIYFNPLDPVTIGHIVGKQLMELEELLLAKNVEITVSAEVREWLSVKGYDKKMGARPMQRLIMDEIKKPLSEQILFGELEQGGAVEVTLKDSKLSFKFKKKTGNTAHLTQATPVVS